jgi:hypothetical protein
MKWKNLVLLVLILAALGAGYGYYLYQKPVPTAAALATDFSLAATELYAAYETDEAAANERYLGKTLELTGTVAAVTTDEAGQVTVQLDAGGLLGGVSCELAPGQTTELQVGEEVRLKGICSGMLMDVVLNRCVVDPA